MLVLLEPCEYYRVFNASPHIFISKDFIEINRQKVEKVLYMTENSNKPTIGLVAGLKNNCLYAPFSAPFGGFHYSHDSIYVNVICKFIEYLKVFLQHNSIQGIEITLPPNIYNETINSKLINCLYNNGFKIKTIDITSWVDLNNYENRFKTRKSRTFLNQAIQNKLTFRKANELQEKIKAYDVININRLLQERPLFMSFSDLEKMNSICEVDYFTVSDSQGEIIASSVFYRYHPTIVYGVFWGDSEEGRPLRSMDFMIFNLLNHYKELKYDYLDLGISTESGIPNEGLLRFKETHEAISSVRYTFKYSPGIQ